MSPKKEEGGGSPPRTLPLPRLMFVLRAHAGARQAVRAAASSSSTCTFVHIIWHCLPISFKPHRSFIHYEARTPDTPNGKPAGLSLNMIWRWPRKKKKRKGEKNPRLLSVGFCAAVAESIAVYLNKGFLLDLERWKADISLHFGKPRHAHGIIVKYNLGCTLQRGLLQLWCTSETNLFSWSLSLWRGCKCYLSFSIKNTAGCAICLAQPSLFFPDAFLCRSFYVAICTNFLYLDFGKHFCFLFFK